MVYFYYDLFFQVAGSVALYYIYFAGIAEILDSFKNIEFRVLWNLIR